jgi:ankyrin repeat protein
MITPIMAASISGYIELVEKLLQLGANVLLKSCNEMSLLEWAKSFSKNEIVELIECYL